MATLIEKINIQIQTYGGREVLARDIEKEWRLNTHSDKSGRWSKEQDAFLEMELKRLCTILFKSPIAIQRRIKKAGHF